MLNFFVATLSCHMVYGYLLKNSSAKELMNAFERKCLFYTLTILISLIFLRTFMLFGSCVNMTVLLWSFSIPFLVNFAYLMFRTVCYKGKTHSNVILWIKTFVSMVFFSICLNAYSQGYICALPRSSLLGHLTFIIVLFSLIISSFFWLYGEKLFCHIELVAYQTYAVMLILTPFLLFFIIEISSNPNIRSISLFNAFLNILIMMFFEAAFLNIFKSKAHALYVLFLVALITGAGNHFVVEFRNNPIMPVDILATRTALSVMGQYHYQLTDGIVTAMLITFLSIALLSVFDRLRITVNKENPKRNRVRRLISITILFWGLLWIKTTNFERNYVINVDYWWPSNTYNNNGFAMAFITFMQNTKVKKPEGYSHQLASQLLGDAKAAKLPDINRTSSKPTIIAIMNESFSDLSVLGDFQCTKEHLKHLYSLQADPNTIEIGLNYVSTRGGGTSTTEFEFLTGNSMSNITGTNPYAQFDFQQVPSIVGLIKSQGYRTIAMHPENPNNWRRKSVYAAMGFDQFLSVGDFIGYDTTVYNRISDLGDYKKLIDIYKGIEGPSFIFNVTMQNHGGYDISDIDTAKRVNIDKEYKQFTDVQAYESLIKESDNAIAYLINYFRSVSGPVIICFFGDHQPALDKDFENQLALSGSRYNDSDLSKQEKYFAVPYFIWSNYPIETDATYDNAVQQDRISTNYLGSQLLHYAGLDLSAYNKFLLNQRVEIPVLNYIGLLDTDYQWRSLSEDAPYLLQLEKYKIIQYNAMFDKKKEKRLYQPQGGF